MSLLINTKRLSTWITVGAFCFAVSAIDAAAVPIDGNNVVLKATPGISDSRVVPTRTQEHLWDFAASSTTRSQNPAPTPVDVEKLGQTGTKSDSESHFTATTTRSQNPAPALVDVEKLVQTGTESDSESHFTASKQPVEQVLTAIGSAMGKPVHISARARTYKVTGDFALDKPMEALERITSSLGLTWYFDGSALYVYEGSESTTVMLTASPLAMNALLAFLKQNALYDLRFPIKYTAQTRLLYLSAPPKYVEIVRSALSLMTSSDAGLADKDYRKQDSEGREAAVVRVRHAFVGDRIYSRRGASIVTPGLATVLAQSLGPTTQLVQAGPAVANGDPNAAPLAPTSALPPPAGAYGTPGDTTGTFNIFSSPLALPAIPPSHLSHRDDSPSPTPEGLRIIAYPSQNSLILAGTPRQINRAKQLIAQLDAPKAQIELSLWVIDISKSDADRLGVNWAAAAQFGALDTRYGLDLLSQGATLSGTQTKQFIAAIVALSDIKKARLVSRPMLLAQDNTHAVYDNSKSFYVKLEAERYASLDRVTYGTMIDVLPRVVNGNGRLEMEIAIEDGNAMDPNLDSHLDMPIVASTHIDTVARVLHDQSLLIGGYTHDESSQRVNKIPLLGDIPFLGGLFRYKNITQTQTIRLFLIQPRVLTDDTPFMPGQVETPEDIDNAVDALKTYLERRHGQPGA